MKRKIFSITLAILLVLSSMGGLTAFAETTATDVSSDAATTIVANTYSASTGTIKWWNGDQMLQLSSGATVTYDLNVAAEGNYGLILNLHNPAGYPGKYEVYIGDNTDLEAQLYTGTADTVEEGQLGIIKLSAGSQKLKIKLSSGYGALKSITLDPTATKVSADEPTTIRANYTANYTSNGSTNKWWRNDGYYEMRQGSYAIYDIKVLDESGYKLKLNLQSPASIPGAYNIYLNDEPVTNQLYTGTVNSDELSNLGVIHLKAGEHKLKIELKSGYAWLKSFTLTACKTDVSSAAAATINPYDYTTESGATWANSSEYLDLTGGYATYTINVLDGGFYNITTDLYSFSLQPKVHIYVDDVKVISSDLITADKGWTLGQLFLNKGEHKIKIERYGGNPWLKSITLASSATVTDVSADAAATIASNNCSDATGGKWYYSDKFLEMTSGNSASYTINVVDSGIYSIAADLRSVSALVPKLYVYVDDTKIISSDTIDTDEEKMLGYISLENGTHTIKLESYGGYAWLNSVTLTAVKPTITIYEGGLDSTTEATGITDGEMSVKVDLNGTTEEGKDALVIFAIYESDGTEFTRLHGSVVIPVAAANLGETAQGSITGISQTSGCSYTAKVFIWDATTITGNVVSFFN